MIEQFLGEFKYDPSPFLVQPHELRLEQRPDKAGCFPIGVLQTPHLRRFAIHCPELV